MQWIILNLSANKWADFYIKTCPNSIVKKMRKVGRSCFFTDIEQAKLFVIQLAGRNLLAYLLTL